MQKYLLFSLCTLFSFSVSAQEAFLDDMGLDFDSDEPTSTFSEPKKEETAVTGKGLSSFISSRLPASAAKNIEKAEKVFCYTVDYPSAEYTGYTINDLAITGSCGELSNDGIEIVKKAVMSNAMAFSTASDNCNIAPKIMLRYFNGIDSTDVLYSSPCHSLTFFHGQDIITLNASPAREIIDEIVGAYSKLSEKFVSPALLGQMVANGMVVSQNQKEMVRKTEASPAIKKWGTEKNDEPKAEQKAGDAQNPIETKTAPKGWNRLKN